MKQHLLPTWVGALKTQFMRTGFYDQFLSISLQIGTFYAVVYEKLAWIQLWMIVSLFIVYKLTMMVFDYVYMYRTENRYTNNQNWKSQNKNIQANILIMQTLVKLAEKQNIDTADIKAWLKDCEK
jgi:hypothetical protein